MADSKNGVYTQGLRDDLKKEHAQKYAERYMQRAHPGEVAQAQYELALFKSQTEPEQVARLISLRRGSTFELLLGLAILGVAFGGGQILQAWFPYTYHRVPVLPSAIGSLAVAAGVILKRSSGLRYGLAMGGAGLMLGGGTVTGAPK